MCVNSLAVCLLSWGIRACHSWCRPGSRCVRAFCPNVPFPSQMLEMLLPTFESSVWVLDVHSIIPHHLSVNQGIVSLFRNFYFTCIVVIGWLNNNVCLSFYLCTSEGHADILTALLYSLQGPSPPSEESDRFWTSPPSAGR